MSKSKGIPAGILVLGLGFVLTSLFHMWTLMDWGQYQYLFQDQPYQVVVVRYMVSWLLRFIGVTAGIGLLRREAWSRQAIIYLSWFAVLTIVWKHPYAGFVRHTAYLDSLLKSYNVVLPNGITFSSLTGISVMVARIFDSLCALLVVYYLPLPRVKSAFHSKKG